MIRNYLPGVPYCYTSGSPYNEGDGITMAMSVGADLWHMNNYAGPVDGAEGAGSPHDVFDAGAALQQGNAGRHDRGRPGRAALRRRKVQDPPRQDPGERTLAAAVHAVPDVHDFRSHAVCRRPALRQAPEPRLDADHRALRVERGQQRRTGEGLDQDAPTAIAALAAVAGARPGRARGHGRPLEPVLRRRSTMPISAAR